MANNGGRMLAPYAAGNGASATSATVPAGHIFGFVVFLMFCLPSKQLSRILLLGVQTDLTELGALILPVVYFFLYRRPVAPSPLSRRSKVVFLLLFTSFGLAGFIFAVAYGLSTLPLFLNRNLRTITPFLSAGLIAIQGIKIDRKVFLRWFCLALLASYAVLVLTYVTGFQRVTDYEGFENVSGAMHQGRFSNQNWQFGVIGIFFLLDPLKRAFCTTVLDQWLVFTVAVLSLVQMLLGFNRTFLVAAVIELLIIQVYVARVKFSVVLKTGMVVAIAVGAILVAYQQVEEVQRQIDKRLLVFTGGAKEAMEDAWDPTKSQTSRGAIVEAAIDHLKKNWLIGIKPGEPLFEAKQRRGWQEVYNTDNSILTVWLRFGLIPLVLFVSFWLSLLADMRREAMDGQRSKYWRNYAKGTAVVLFVFVLGSVNTSALLFHNAVLFALLFSFLWRDNTCCSCRPTSR